MGEKYDEPLLKRLFDAYLDAVPEAQQKVIYSYIMSSFVDSPLTSRGASLKTILGGHGPFWYQGRPVLKYQWINTHRVFQRPQGFFE